MSKYEIRMKLADKWLVSRLGRVGDGMATAEYMPVRVRFECGESDSRTSDEVALTISQSLYDDVMGRGYIVRSITLCRMEKSQYTDKKLRPIHIWEKSEVEPIAPSPEGLNGWGPSETPIPFYYPDPKRWAMARIGKEI